MSWSKALESKKNGNNIDFFDAEGGFCVVSIPFIGHLNIDHSNINDKGAAIVMRYPMRAIGCIIFRVTQDKLERQNKNTVFVS